MNDKQLITNRLRYAVLQRNSLERSVRNYSKRYPIDWDSEIAKDGYSWWVKTRVKKRPPLQNWALRHGDIVHNLRSILDNIIWLKAHDYSKPTNPKLLYFPICTQRDDWAKKSKGLEDQLPKNLLDYLKPIQPCFNDTEDSLSFCLKLIHLLDIQNKHHLPSVVGTSSQQTLGNTFKPEYERQVNDSDFVQHEISTINFSDEQIIWLQRSEVKVKKIKKGIIRIVDANFMIKIEDNTEQPLIGSLDFMLDSCRQIINDLL